MPQGLNGSFFIVTGESAAGKTTIVSAAVERGVAKKLITCTTRPPRTNNGVMEVSGVDYHFLSPEEFNAALLADEFAEHARVYGSNTFYGNRKSDIAESRCLSPITLAVVDIQGAETLSRVYPDAWTIFVHVPKKDIERRLHERGGLTAESIAERLLQYDAEWARAATCHEIIVNVDGKLSETVEQFIALLDLYRRVDVYRAANPR